MKLNAPWPSLLETARLGDLAPAREARKGLDPSGALADYFYARCLVEAGARGAALAEATILLRGALAQEPGNPLMLHALALALARAEEPAAKAEAAALWRQHGLPHDLDLLGQCALTLELDLRPWPAANQAEGIAWPEGLPTPPPLPEGGFQAAAFAPELTLIAAAAGTPPEPEALAASAVAAARERDKMSTPAATKQPAGAPRLSLAQRRRLERGLGAAEDDLLNHRPRPALERLAALLKDGLESGELHLLAGFAAEDLGDASRARAHLGEAMRLAPGLLLARTWLGRIYWRLGWFDLALALWRSLPVEGPNDYGRHYHLALGYAAVGNTAAALEAIQTALQGFYYDTMHFYLKRVLGLWLARFGAPAPEGR